MSHFSWPLFRCFDSMPGLLPPLGGTHFHGHQDSSQHHGSPRTCHVGDIDTFSPLLFCVSTDHSTLTQSSPRNYCCRYIALARSTFWLDDIWRGLFQHTARRHIYPLAEATSGTTSPGPESIPLQVPSVLTGWSPSLVFKSCR